MTGSYTDKDNQEVILWDQRKISHVKVNINFKFHIFYALINDDY